MAPECDLRKRAEQVAPVSLHAREGALGMRGPFA